MILLPSQQSLFLEINCICLLSQTETTPPKFSLRRLKNSKSPKKNLRRSRLCGRYAFDCHFSISLWPNKKCSFLEKLFEMCCVFLNLFVGTIVKVVHVLFQLIQLGIFVLFLRILKKSTPPWVLRMLSLAGSCRKSQDFMRRVEQRYKLFSCLLLQCMLLQCMSALHVSWAQFHKACKHKNLLRMKFLPRKKNQDHQPNFNFDAN